MCLPWGHFQQESLGSGLGFGLALQLAAIALRYVWQEKNALSGCEVKKSLK